MLALVWARPASGWNFHKTFSVWCMKMDLDHLANFLNFPSSCLLRILRLQSKVEISAYEENSDFLRKSRHLQLSHLPHCTCGRLNFSSLWGSSEKFEIEIFPTQRKTSEMWEIFNTKQTESRKYSTKLIFRKGRKTLFFRVWKNGKLICAFLFNFSLYCK